MSISSEKQGRCYRTLENYQGDIVGIVVVFCVIVCGMVFWFLTGDVRFLFGGLLAGMVIGFGLVKKYVGLRNIFVNVDEHGVSARDSYGRVRYFDYFDIENCFINCDHDLVVVGKNGERLVFDSSSKLGVESAREIERFIRDRLETIKSGAVTS